MKGVGAALQPERAHQADHAEEVVGVEMREEDFVERERHAVAHHLALSALTAVDEKRLALAHDGEPRNVAFHGGAGGRRAEKGDGEHGGEYKPSTAWGV